MNQTGNQNTGNTKKLIVGSDATFPPMEVYHESNGTFTGFDIDLMREIARVMNYTVEFRNVGWDALPVELSNGNIDVIASSMTITDERKADREFTEPYYLVDQSVMVGKDSGITNVQQLQGKRIAVQGGTTGDLYATNNISGAQVNRFDDYPSAANALVTGAVDAVIMDRPPQVFFASENPSVVVAFDIDTNEPLGFAIKKGRLDLVNQMNDALDQLRADGTLDRLRQKYDL